MVSGLNGLIGSARSEFQEPGCEKESVMTPCLVDKIHVLVILHRRKTIQPVKFSLPPHN